MAPLPETRTLAPGDVRPVHPQGGGLATSRAPSLARRTRDGRSTAEDEHLNVKYCGSWESFVPSKKIIYLNEADTIGLANIQEIIGYCEEAYRLYGRYQSGEAYANFSPMISYPTKGTHTDVDYRSGVMDGIPTVCSTLGWGFWDNPIKHKLPSVSVLVSLNDIKTGLPVCMMTG